MSKHLRFKSLLGSLAILLALSMSWGSVSAQNVSSEKAVVSYSVAGQVGSTVIDNALLTIDLTVPYGSVANLATTFQISPFAQMYLGKVTAGTFGTATLMVSGSSYDYTSAMTTPSTFYVTVEAENHSFVYYLVTVKRQAASTAAELLTVQLDYTKSYVLCGVKQTAAKTATTPWAGLTAVNFTTEANPSLDAVTLYFTMPAGATATLNGSAVTSGTAHDFDSDNNGVAEAQTLVITAQDGVTKKTYTLNVASALPSVADDLLSFTYNAALAAQPAGFTNLVSVDIDHTTNVIDVVVNYWALASGNDLTDLIPTFTMSTYATASTAASWVGGPVAAQAAEVCSAVTEFGGATNTLYVYGEDRTEISTWTVNITQATARTGNSLLSMNANYTMSWGHSTCLQTATGGPIAASINQTTKVITFDVPFSVTAVTIGSYTLSDGATISPTSGSLTNGASVVVTSEAGVANTYTVALKNAPASTEKDLLTFGFMAVDNPGTGITATHAGTISGGLVVVVVPWNTDLYSLVPYFTTDPFATVWIAGPNGITYDPQCSRVTVNDFSNSLTYVVRAEDGTEERWDVSVIKENVLTENELTDFMLTDVDMCVGPDITYGDSYVTYDGTDITVSVRNGQDLTALSYAFEISEGATSSVALTGTRDFATPLTVTVTAQNGDAVTYTITVVVRNTTLKSVAKIKEYWFDRDDNSGFAADVIGEINETAKTIHLWVPWGTDVTDLVASFVLENEPWVRMTRSEDLITDPELMQYSGVSSNDYITPIAYTVYAEDCSTVEYFVTVYVTPNTETGISSFAFCYSDCGCNLVSEIDAYAKRIHVTVPYTVSITNLAACSYTIHPEAKISPDPLVARDWSKGPVTFTVTAPDGVTKTTWSVLVENPPCQETDIVSFSLPEIQVSSSSLNPDYHSKVVTIDKDNHTINVIIKSGANLSKVYYQRSLSCGAEICCVTGNCVDNHYLDFSNDLCHTCVVTAQDESITQEWTICLEVIDTDCPTVVTESVMAMNCSDSVAVTSNEMGEVFIIHEDALECMDNYYACNCSPSNPLGDKDVIADFIAEKMLAKATVTAAGQPTYVRTDGLYSGVYYAFSIDTWGNVSCQSKQKLFLDICEKEVANLTDLRAADPAYMYTVTGEVVVSYEETVSGGNLKFVQDAGAGIEIRDLNAGCAVKYGVGAGLTNLKGMIVDSYSLSGNSPCAEEDECVLVFVPICCYTPTVSSTGNVIDPIMLTFDEFMADPTANEAMLIRITTPLMIENDYTGSPVWNYISSRVNSDLFVWDARGEYDWIVAQIFNANYIGDDLPDGPKIYQGINTRYIYGGSCYGAITPRWTAEKSGDPTDILDVPCPIISASPTPVNIDGVPPGSCSSLTDVDVINEGACDVTITALYLDDNSGQDEFELIFPTPVPFGLSHWGNAGGYDYIETVQVQFCPKDAGNESAILVVEYEYGTPAKKAILEVPINGTTVSVFDAPYFTNFNSNTPGSTLGWSHTNMIYGNNLYNMGVDGQIFYYGWSWVTPNSARPVILESPGFNIGDLQNPVVTWWTGTYFASNLRVDISTNMKQTWTTLVDYGSFTLGNAVGKFFEVDLSAYEGTATPIFLRWYSTQANYYGIDNVKVDQKITTPLYKGSADALDFGGVQLGETATATYTISNIGVSVLKVKSVSYSGNAAYTLTDTNLYPFEIHDGAYAYTVDPSGDALTVTVNYTPTEVGEQNGMLTIHYGMYDDQVVTVPIRGEGLSCYTAAEAVLGENLAPSPNTWYTYTAESFMMLYIHSCDPRNTTDPFTYSYDSYLKVFADCEGTLIAEKDDLEEACSYNRASSGIMLPLNEGETIKIFWDGIFMTECETCALPFYFHLDASYPIDGDVCETAIPLTLPVVNHFGTTVGFEDDYDLSPCSPFSNYMDGNDKVYTINLETEGYLTGNILGAYGSIHVLDKCPKVELEKNNCKAFIGGPNGGEFTKRIAAGEYYVIISTWAPPQTVDYLLNMSFEESSSVDNDGLTSSLSVYPNPTDGRFTVSISNAEATDLTVELVNISGQVVYRNEVKAVYTYNEDIDASEFAKGVYYLKVNDGQEVKVEKVVIQ